MNALPPTRGNRPSRFAIAACAAAVLLIAGTTLRSDPAQAERTLETAWTCLVCGEAGVADVLLNLLLFVPLGLSLRLLGWRCLPTVAIAATFTIMVEGVQATVLQGRDASLSDVLANTLGAVVGWMAASRLREALDPSRQVAARLAALWFGLGAMVWLGTAWGLAPEGSPQAPWVGQHTRVWPGYEPFPGQLLSAAVNEVEIPNNPLATTPAIHDSLALTIRLTLAEHVTPERPVSILRVVDGAGRIQIAAGRRGDALVVGSRVRADRVRLRSPSYRFPRAFELPLGTPVTLVWRWTGKEMVLTQQLGGSSDAEIVERLPVSVGLGWAFVHPFATTIDPHALWWSALWIALWLAPLGWFLACLAWRARVAGLVAAMSAFVGASLLHHLPVLPSEGTLAVCSLGVGLWASSHRRSERSAPSC